MLRKKEDEKYFKIAVTGVAILLIGMVCFFLFIESADLAPFFHDLIGILSRLSMVLLLLMCLRPTCRWWEKELRKLLVRAHVKHAQELHLHWQSHFASLLDTYYCNCIIYACNSSGYNKYNCRLSVCCQINLTTAISGFHDNVRKISNYAAKLGWFICRAVHTSA